MQTTLNFLPPPVNQRTKILLALLTKPYISEAENFSKITGFRMRLSELRQTLLESGIILQKVKHEFVSEFGNPGWIYRYFIEPADSGKGTEVYNRINKR
jgi:hypothetical protein